jgi:hypothetical protein
LKSPILLNFLCFLLSCLFLLHCHFFILFIRLLQKYIEVGATEDEQEKKEIDSDTEEYSSPSSSDESLFDKSEGLRKRNLVDAEVIHLV